jgi:hypothetical protein
MATHIVNRDFRQKRVFGAESIPLGEKVLAWYLADNPTNRALDAATRCRLWGDRRNSAT